MEEFQEFPKTLYKSGNVNESKTVNSAAEEQALGDEWIDAVIDPDTLAA
jgi:hypothetical protein